MTYCKHCKERMEQLHLRNTVGHIDHHRCVGIGRHRLLDPTLDSPEETFLLNFELFEFPEIFGFF